MTRLPFLEELRAAEVGYRRQRIAVESQREPRHRGGSLWGGHIESACAELLVSRWLALPWTGETVWERPPDVRLPDVGELVEVRWVAPSREPVLNFDAEKDKDERFYVLVSGFSPEFEIHGYVKGEDARQEAWKHRYPERTVYRVPAAALRYLKPG